MDVFDLCASLSLDKSQYDKGLGEAEKSGSSIGSRIGAGFAKVGKAVTVGIGAASTAVGALASMSVKGYSDYEQLAGGVETLFKKSSQSVINNASKAYQTAGMSANEYMETVTGFSASLLQSLGGDTQKAAEKADTAIRDMSDNANKMGTDIESIQNAYQGFAKQNYTMLDNLKLGYGGTKEEMARLIKDANRIKEANGEMGDLSINSFADIVEAIHTVQNEMGITGTTAEEASSTIQGSISSMQAAWTNLITGLADPDADLDALINGFVDSVTTVGENIIPKIEVIFNGIAKVIEKLTPKIIEALPGVIEKILPVVVSGLSTLMDAIIDAAPQLVSNILSLLPDILSAVGTLVKKINSALPKLAKMLFSALPKLIPQLVSTITDVVSDSMKHTGEILQPLIDNLPQIIIAVVDGLLDNLPNLLEGINSLVMGIVKAIPDIISGLTSALPFIVERVILSLIECLPQIINGLIELTVLIVAHLPEIIMGLIKALPGIIETMANELIECAPRIWEAFSQIFTNAWTTIQEVFAPIGEFFYNIFSDAFDGIKNAWNGITGFFSGLLDGIKGVFSGIGGWFSGIFDDAVEGIKTAWDGIATWFQTLWDGICAIIKAPINAIISGFNGIIDGLNSISFDIPDWVPFVGGKHFGIDLDNIPELAKGGVVKGGTPFIAGEAGAEAVIPLENNNQWIYKFAHAFADGLSTFYGGNNFVQTPTKGAGGKIVNINLYLDNVNVKNDDDIEDVANKVSERIAEKLVAEGMAVG